MTLISACEEMRLVALREVRGFATARFDERGEGRRV